jgi:RNA polymerase sigma factor (sigma-70 family)
MESAEPRKTNQTTVPSQFNTTHWSVVLAASTAEPPQAREALENLCRTYWFPLYAWARHQGHQPADAEDLTQGFIEHLLEHDSLRNAVSEKGRFRSFLLASFRHYLTDAARSASALKRGGGMNLLPLDSPQVEERYRQECVDPDSPDQLYDRRWALAAIERVLTRLREEAVARGHGKLFEKTKTLMLGEHPSSTYAEMAATLEMSAGAVRVAVHRLRQRYRELFIEEVTHTVSRPEDVQEEVAYLLRAIGG